MKKIIVILFIVLTSITTSAQLSLDRQKEIFNLTIVPFLEQTIQTESGEVKFYIESVKLVNFIDPDGGYPRFNVAVIFSLYTDIRNNVCRIVRLYRAYSIWAVDYSILAYTYTDLDDKVMYGYIC